MKKCPFCSEEIQDEAIKCRFCGEFLNQTAQAADKPKAKWYFSPPAVVIGLLSLGPLFLPLVWFHPRYKIAVKIMITVLVVIFTVWSYYMTRDLYRNMMSQLKSLGM